MKRRKAIGTILLAGGATAAGFAGYEWYTLTKNPDTNYLISRKTLLRNWQKLLFRPPTHREQEKPVPWNFMMELLE